MANGESNAHVSVDVMWSKRARSWLQHDCCKRLKIQTWMQWQQWIGKWNLGIKWSRDRWRYVSSYSYSCIDTPISVSELDKNKIAWK